MPPQNHHQKKFLISLIIILTGIVIFYISQLESFWKSWQKREAVDHHDGNRTINTELYTHLTNEIKSLQEEHNQDVDKRKKIERLKQSLEQERERNKKNSSDIYHLQNDTDISKVKEKSLLFETYEVCSYLPSPSFSSTQIWSQYLPQIFAASVNPFKPTLETDENKNITKNLLMIQLTPARLRRAIRHLPTFQHATVKRIFNIIEKRLQDSENNPPLRIAVFGGSVTIGRGCGGGREMQDFKCAWPQRFELLVNQFFGKEIIKIYNLGIGGTGSSTATRIIEYWMYADSNLYENGPDVIINSYSTNDSLPPWIGSSKPTMTTHDVIALTTKMQMNAIQSFLRTALTSKRCDIQPLVIHVDDYLGPQQEQLMGELSYISVLTQFAKWYDTGVVSYPEVVRDIVYKNTSDPTFFNQKDVHYGHFAHQVISWSLGFSSIELLSNYCADELHRRTFSTSMDEIDQPLAESLNNGTYTPILPPPLTESLLLSNVTKEFQATLDSMDRSEINFNCSSISKENRQNPCEVAWISTPGGFQAGQIKNFMNIFTTHNNGWEVETNGAFGWSNKVGWATNQPNSSFTLHFSNVTTDLNTLNVAHLKSYGEKWEGSRSKFSGTSYGSDNKTIFVQEISGLHNITASLTIIEKISFSQTVRKGESMDVRVDLVSGNTFKILGLMLCAF
jgi:hypothetical protein